MVVPTLDSIERMVNEVTTSKSNKNYVILVDKEKRIELLYGTTLEKAYKVCEYIIRNTSCFRVEVFNGDFCEFTMINNRVEKKK